MIDFVSIFLVRILGVFFKDYVTNILPWQLKAIAKKRLLYISPNINGKEREEIIEIRKKVFKGFLRDCKCEDSLIMKYKMIISLVLAPRNNGDSTPKKINNKK